MTDDNNKVVEGFKAALAQYAKAKSDLNEAQINLYNEYKDNIVDKGTNTFGDVKIVTGYNDSWDQDMLAEIHSTLDRPEIFPFKSEFKLDRKRYDALETFDGALYKRINSALTLKPKKPSFSIKEKK